MFRAICSVWASFFIALSDQDGTFDHKPFLNGMNIETSISVMVDVIKTYHK